MMEKVQVKRGKKQLTDVSFCHACKIKYAQQTVKRNWLIEAKDIEIYPAYTNEEGKESSVQENAFHGAN